MFKCTKDLKGSRRFSFLGPNTEMTAAEFYFYLDYNTFL